jgi:hypothetical protein
MANEIKHLPMTSPKIPLLSLCAGNRSVRSHLTCQFTHAINSPAQGFGIAVDS